MRTKKKVCITKKDYQTKRLCLYCVKPLFRDGRLPTSNQRYHFECSQLIIDRRAENAALKKSGSAFRVCIGCGVRFKRTSLNQQNFCKDCAIEVKERSSYNESLRRNIACKDRKCTSGTRKQRRTSSRSFIKKPGEFNNEVLRRCAYDEAYRKKLNLPDKETAQIVEYDTVNAEGVPVHVEVRGQGFCCGARYNR